MIWDRVPHESESSQIQNPSHAKKIHFVAELFLWWWYPSFSFSWSCLYIVWASRVHPPDNSWKPSYTLAGLMTPFCRTSWFSSFHRVPVCGYGPVGWADLGPGWSEILGNPRNRRCWVWGLLNSGWWLWPVWGVHANQGITIAAFSGPKAVGWPWPKGCSSDGRNSQWCGPASGSPNHGSSWSCTQRTLQNQGRTKTSLLIPKP